MASYGLEAYQSALSGYTQSIQSARELQTRVEEARRAKGSTLLELTLPVALPLLEKAVGAPISSYVDGLVARGVTAAGRKIIGSTVTRDVEPSPDEPEQPSLAPESESAEPAVSSEGQELATFSMGRGDSAFIRADETAGQDEEEFGDEDEGDILGGATNAPISSETVAPGETEAGEVAAGGEVAGETSGEVAGEVGAETGAEVGAEVGAETIGASLTAAGALSAASGGVLAPIAFGAALIGVVSGLQDIFGKSAESVPKIAPPVYQAESAFV